MSKPKTVSMPHTHPKIVTQLTPPGRGAVATVRVEGVDAVETVDRFFLSRSGKRLAETPADRPLVGHFHSPRSPASEEVVVRRCPAVNGDAPAIEIHCHGGTASVTRILETFQASGYRSIAWDEWVEKKGTGTFCVSRKNRSEPFLCKRSQSPFSREAYRDLARAQTELTAGLLLDQYHGALDRELEQIRQCADRDEQQRRLDTLLDRATWGVHLTRPWQIVLAGSPNVGKSSLMNRLLGYDRAITDATPGTTRDLVRAQTVFGGWPVELIDTAGLRTGEHPVEQLGVRLAMDQLRSADLVLLLLDATRPPTEEELGLVEKKVSGTFCAKHPSGRSGKRYLTPFFLVRSKSDLAEGRDAWGSFAETATAAAAIDTSAATGKGIEQLIAAVESRLFPPLPEPGTPIPWTERQIAELRG